MTLTDTLRRLFDELAPGEWVAGRASAFRETNHRKDHAPMSEDTTTQPPEAIGPCTTAEEARAAAIAWQHGFSDRTMTWGELADETNYFAELAERFGLTEEFQENGII